MFNKIIMIGNLTRDVELRYLPSGSAVATIGLASNRRFKKQDGSQGEEVCFVDVKLFGRTAEVANQYLKKGSQVLIEGRLTLETWNDTSGAKKSKHTITAESMQMLGRTGIDNNHSNNSNYTSSYEDNYNVNNSEYNSSQNQQKNIPEINIDDEIPF
ncbi:single-stranded DNA-binding protein [Helicobacter sp. MIT 14-3879]|uniref:single-stranded DNA-binding protein n=1 Tax=Helicobacter sp. MIT 14-3879 TaxID=2040649 RepID=UPI000E1EB98C|nr:single-stranded DNA-binding protein [Helicobacter sp. MIT 14-3879]RDU65115.1 single-stranded DNA-binding protein [Helicobacter sp. MIT 14-3879]